MMTVRLIDADALADILDRLAYDDWNQGVSTSWAEAFSEVVHIVRNDAPTIDAVEVVRCKDCKYSDATINGGVYCLRTSSFGWTDDSYCSDGEKE